MLQCKKTRCFLNRDLKDQYPSVAIDRYFNSYLLFHVNIQKPNNIHHFFKNILNSKLIVSITLIFKFWRSFTMRSSFTKTKSRPPFDILSLQKGGHWYKFNLNLRSGKPISHLILFDRCIIKQSFIHDFTKFHNFVVRWIYA